jgi:tripartite-type tricarboxylate transporter receptor subunit TctC
MIHNDPTQTFPRRAVLRMSAAAAAASALGAQAQSAWPAKPVTLVVPFPAGGGTDAFARPLSAQFARLTSKQLVIDNRGGAGGTLGAGIAAKAAPDGYTLFMGAVHHAIAPSMYPKLDYDIEKDFVPLALVANVPQVLVINPKKVPVNDFKGFLEFVRKNRQKELRLCWRWHFSPSGRQLFKQQNKTFIHTFPIVGQVRRFRG